MVTALALSACSGGSSAEEEGATEESTAQELPRVLANGTTLLDLSDYFFPFSLYVPDSTRGYPEIIETGYGETVVRVGSTFNMLIAEGGDLAMKRSEIADDLMYTNKIVEEGEDYILYSSEIKDSFLELEFHFYAVKQVNGLSFEFKDNKDEGPFAESIARFMLESIGHLQPKPNAS